MRFEWDEDKNRRNLAKHKVSFETASLVSRIPRRSAFRIALSRERSGGRRLEGCLALYCWWPIPIGTRVATT